MVRVLLLLVAVFLVACDGSDPAPQTGAAVDAPESGDAVEPTAEGEPSEPDDDVRQDDGVIRLPEGDFTEAGVRGFTRTNIAAFGRDLYCDSFMAAESDAELLSGIRADYLVENPDVHEFPLAEVTDADLLRYGKITQEECRATSE